MKDIIYSIVIPVYNEEENLLELYHRLKKVLVNLDELYGIIFVNDGSMDRTRDIIYELRNSDPNIKLISFSRNFGHQTSVSAGLDFASGHATIMMDGDLQDPPEIIPRLIEKWQEGYKVVYALRKKRKEGLFKRFAYSTFYRLLKKISYIDIPLDSGDFSLIDRKVVDLLIKMPERNKFIRGLRAWVGFQQIGIEYERDKRYAGEPKYSLNKLLNLALDGLISFSYAPLKLATSFGFVVSGFASMGGHPWSHQDAQCQSLFRLQREVESFRESSHQVGEKPHQSQHFLVSQRAHSLLQSTLECREVFLGTDFACQPRMMLMVGITLL